MKGEREVHLSHTFAGQKSKSVFVEMSERSAETARLLQEARQAQSAQLPKQRRSLARWAVVQWDHLLQRIGKRIAPREAESPS
jgi:phage terminase Nu1 subunit (DNA packaging protein)